MVTKNILVESDFKLVVVLLLGSIFGKIYKDCVESAVKIRIKGVKNRVIISILLV